MSRALINPAAAVSQQQTLPFTTKEKRYWDSLPVVRYDELLEKVDLLLDYDRCLVPDPCLISIPVALGKDPLGESWCALELLDREHSSFFPSRRTGVVNRLARSILRDIPLAERSMAPWSRETCGEDRPIPPWITDRATLDTLEKSIRTVVWEALPEFAGMKDAEDRMAEASSQAYLKTGYYAYANLRHNLPRAITGSDELMGLIRRADDTMADWYGTNIDKLLEAMLIPKHVFYSGDDEPFLFSPTTAKGKVFGPVTQLGLSGEDVATIAGHIEDERLGWTSPWGRSPLPRRCRPHFEALMSFLDEAKRREYLEIVD